MEAEINTGDAKPVAATPYRISPKERDIIRAEVGKMLKLGCIKPSKSPWASLPVLVDKPDGTKRFCVDYRGLNAVSKADAYPLPRIDDVLATLQGSKFFSCMDANSGFWQLKMREEDQEKTAFLTPDGQFCYVVMPFGLKGASAEFQRMMNTILAGMTWVNTLVYIDDVSAYTKTFDEHLDAVIEILTRMYKAGMTVKLSKCKFFMSRLELLGHVVDGVGTRPSPQKVQALKDILLPTNIRELRGYLGMCGWYRKFVPNYATVARPLTELTKQENIKKIPTEIKKKSCVESFEKLRDALMGPEVMLFHPDFNKRFRVDLDASCEAIGGVLLQQDDAGVWRPVEYLSKKIAGQIKDDAYAPTHLEALALQECVNRWRPYLIDKEFDLVTDHHALKSLPTRKIDQNRLVRHQILMQPYQYRIIYKPGKMHVLPDGFSRLPEPSETIDTDTYADQIPVCEATEPLPSLMLGMLVCGSEKEWQGRCMTKCTLLAPGQANQLLVMGNAMNEDGPMQMDKNVCLHPGSPEDPGLELPTDERLKELQREDKFLKRIMDYLDGTSKEKLKMPPHELTKYRLTDEGLLIREVSGLTRPARNRKRKREKEAVKRGLDVLQDPESNGDKTESPMTRQRVIPAVGNVRASLMRYFHGSAAKGHPGVRRTVDNMKQMVFWKGMWQEVHQFISACPCMKDGPMPKGRLCQAPHLAHIVDEVTGPNQLVCIDHAHMPIDEEGYMAVLVMTDAYSKLPVIEAVRDLGAKSTVEALINGWIRHHGVPLRVHSDGARAIHGDLMKMMAQRFGFQKTKITPGNPRGNALAENLVHRAKLALTNLASRFPTKWRDFLGIVNYSLSMTLDEEMGVPPFTAHWGKLPNAVVEMETPIQEERESPGLPSEERKAKIRRQATEMLEALTNSTKVLCDVRHEQMKKADRYHNHIKTEALQTNEIVWYMDEQIKTKRQDVKKLHNPRTGPFRIKKMSKDGQNAVLEISDGKEKRINVRLLLRYIAPMAGIYPTAGRGYTQGVPIAVMAHRFQDGGDQYLTRYLSEDGEVQEWNAWELLPPSMIQDYLTALEHNPWLHLYHTGRRVGVWWPLEHRTFKGVVTSLRGNLARIDYDDGDVGEAMILEGGQIVQAETYDERTEDPSLKKPARQNVPPEGDGKERPKRGRPVGAKDSKPRTRGRGGGKGAIPPETLAKGG